MRLAYQGLKKSGQEKSVYAKALSGEEGIAPSPSGWDQLGMEQQWIEAAKAGDKASFANLIKLHLPAILALAKRMLGNEAEAEDLAQDVLIGLWKDLKKFDPARSKLSTWIYSITSNRCIDKLRKRQIDQLDDDFDQPVPEHQEQELFNKQIGKMVEQKLDGLPPRQKLALVLFHYEGHSLKEIAAITSTSEDAVESLLARARRTLKQTLLPSWQLVKQAEEQQEKS